ncbi:hypothetical protein VSS74_10690 [Conexibacter stalactiti]|uniref:Uncharacterized protein n=1 Tax=Conexibacter stalactiti TaxID=1940611 RepID=A0ABU4HNG0_9ACTN|nr:hypothetical protein [Conexibacter stalactiti]MDW5594807.1 hypothetical protein [Conexibacter stalactiti]MEC5035449.1 hypothetical protein [Conexibacter stalactiti]
MRLRTLLLGALCGAAVAVVLALALRPSDHGSAASAADPLAGGGVAAPAGTAPRVSAVAPRPPDGRRDHRIVGHLRIAARAGDPDGGPAWAIRAYGLRRTWRERDGRVLVRPRNDCMQLGRLLDGRFGWVDGANVFRPVAPAAPGAPEQCGPPVGALSWPRTVQRLTRITHPRRGGEPQALQTVEWALPSRAGEAPLLAVGGAARERAARAEYRVADPGGGLPWGFPRDEGRGSACLTSFGQLVGARPGRVDMTLDVVSAVRYEGFCPNNDGNEPLTRRRPLFTWVTSQPQSQVGSPRDRRIARTLPGLTTLVGRAHPEVVAITVSGPRDVRTITPSPRDRVFAVVWDGTFPTGSLLLRARMRDGSVRVQRAWVWRS